MYPEKQRPGWHGKTIIGKVIIMEGICNQTKYIDRYQRNKQITNPSPSPQGRTGKLQDKPDDTKGNNTNQHHTQCIHDREIFVVDDHRQSIEQRPEKNLHAEQKKTKHPAVTNITEPQ